MKCIISHDNFVFPQPVEPGGPCNQRMLDQLVFLQSRYSSLWRSHIPVLWRRSFREFWWYWAYGTVDSQRYISIFLARSRSSRTSINWSDNRLMGLLTCSSKCTRELVLLSTSASKDDIPRLIDRNSLSALMVVLCIEVMLADIVLWRSASTSWASLSTANCRSCIWSNSVSNLSSVMFVTLPTSRFIVPPSKYWMDSPRKTNTTVYNLMMVCLSC